MSNKRQTRQRIIASEVDIRDGVKALRRKCAVIRRVHDVAGDPPLRLRPAGLDGLARIVVAQQLSVASANAIWNRFEAAVTPLNAANILAASDDTLRGAGLSRPKIKTLRAMAGAVSGGLDLERLDHLDDSEVDAALTEISGIGPWTSDIFRMFCLGRADAFAAGDLALQIAAGIAFEREERPTASELVDMAETWRPWRGVAARLLWAYYAEVKMPKSGVPV